MSSDRITLKLKEPNKLFEKWLIEWRDEAVQKQSKKHKCYEAALESLRMFPLPLRSGKDCRLLKGFGETLCSKIDNKLEQFYGAANLQSAIVKDTHSKRKELTPDKLHKPKKQRNHSPNNKKVYTPVYRSGPYAILVALYKHTVIDSSTRSLLKKDIVKFGQHFCDVSFTKNPDGSVYTAWSSMSTLLNKKLVKKEGNPPKFSLTDLGVDLTLKLYENDDNAKEKEYTFYQKINCNSTNEEAYDKNSKILHNCDENISEYQEGREIINDIDTQNNNCSIEINKILNENTNNCLEMDKPASNAHTSKKHGPNRLEVGKNKKTANSNVDEHFIFAQNSFDILLLVDTQETAGSKNIKEDVTIFELNRLKAPFEVRNLKVGDYAWIARERKSGKELILPYIAERKRMDDLGSSIKDGRFHEQKFRLKRCGIQNIIYLVESYGSNKFTGLPLNTLFQAATNTLLQDNFSVKYTQNSVATLEYLAMFTRVMINVYKNKTLMSSSKENLTNSSISDDLVSLMTFSEFNKFSTKTKAFKVRELFIKQLIQIKGLSVDKALAITQIYQTPRILQEAYASCTPQVGSALLTDIPSGKFQKKIGAMLSDNVFKLFSLSKY